MSYGKNTYPGAAWNKQMKNGGTYFSFSISEDIPAGSKVSMFPNKNKKSENHPDWSLVMSAPETKEEQEESPF